MKQLKFSFLLILSFFVNTLQVNAQCNISNLSITSINCTPNALNPANNDLTYCGSFTATNTNGNYDFIVSHQVFGSKTESYLGLTTDGVINFCVVISNVAFIPEHFVVGEQGSITCSASISGSYTTCQARPSCVLTNLNISNVCCDGNGGLRVVGNFTAANGSGNYRLQVDGLPQGGFPGPSQMVNLPAASMNGVVNFDIIMPNFDFTNIGSGLYISDNFLVCSTSFGSMPPTSASACTSCTTPVAQAPIPTMNQWGLLIFGLLVVNLGSMFVYRKQKLRVK